MWKILGIKETSDEDAIKAAYREQLVHVNPEEDPEGFKKLRVAYEEAQKWAQKANKEKGPLEQWIFDIEEVYKDFYRRIDEDEWDELFEAEVCTDLDTEEEARIEITKFLMHHYMVPQFVWKKVWETFSFEEDREILREKISGDFLSYMEYRMESEDYFDYQLFEGDFDSDYDEYMKKIYAMKNYMDEEKYDLAGPLIEEISLMDIRHPYVDMEILKYKKQMGDEGWKDVLMELRDSLYEDPQLYALEGELKEEEGDAAEAERLYIESIRLLPEYNIASRKLIELYEKQEKYEEAKKICLDSMEQKMPDEKICAALTRLNEHLMKIWKDDEKKQIDLAWCYYQNQKHDMAMAVLRKLKPEGEIYFDYYNLISRVLLEVKEYEEGLRMTQIWIRNIENLSEDEKDYRRKKKRYGYAHFIASMHCLGMGHEENCENYLRRAMELDTDQVDLMMYREIRMDFFNKNKQYERCIKEANTLLEMSEYIYPAYIYRQEAHYHLYHVQQVMDDFYRAIEMVPELGRPYNLVLKMLLGFNMLQQAQEVIAMGQRNGVKEPEFQFYVLECERLQYESLDQLERIANEMEELVDKMKENQADAWYRLGMIYDRFCDEGYESREREWIERALSFAKLAVEKDGETAQHHWLLGDLYYKLEDYENAISSYEQVIELDQTLAEIWIDLGNAYAGAQKVDKAIETLETGSRVCNNHSTVHNTLMNLYLRRFSENREVSDYKAAISHANSQLKITPTAYYYRERAYVYIENGELEKAKEDILKSYELEPEDLYALSSAGYIYRLLGEYEKAIDFYKLAEPHAHTPSEKFGMYRWWAVIYERNGQLEQALECYKKCEKLMPDRKDVCLDIAMVYMRMYEYKKAIEYYKYMIRIGEGNKNEHLIEIARAYHYNKQPIKCLKYLKQAEAAAEGDGHLLSQLGEFYLEEKNNLKKAYQFYYQACGIHTEEPYVRLVEVFSKMGKPEDAKKMCRLAEKTITKMYGSMEDFFRKKEYQKFVYYNIAMMYYYSGELQTAREYLIKTQERPMCYFCAYGFCYEQEFVKASLAVSEGKKQEALRICKKILHQDHNLGEIWQLKNKLEER